MLDVRDIIAYDIKTPHSDLYFDFTTFQIIGIRPVYDFAINLNKVYVYFPGDIFHYGLNLQSSYIVVKPSHDIPLDS